MFNLNWFLRLSFLWSKSTDCGIKNFEFKLKLGWVESLVKFWYFSHICSYGSGNAPNYLLRMLQGIIKTCLLPRFSLPEGFDTAIIGRWSRKSKQQWYILADLKASNSRNLYFLNQVNFVVNFVAYPFWFRLQGDFFNFNQQLRSNSLKIAKIYKCLCF